MELWTAATPNGWKVTIMIEELFEAGVELPPISVHEVSLLDGEQFSSEFTAKNPNQKIPVLVDGDLAIFESGAALLYLAEKFSSQLLPQGEARWGVLPWLFWQAANIGPVFGNKLSYTRYMDDVDTEKKYTPSSAFPMRRSACCVFWIGNSLVMTISAGTTTQLPTSPVSHGCEDGSGARLILRGTPTSLPG